MSTATAADAPGAPAAGERDLLRRVAGLAADAASTLETAFETPADLESADEVIAAVAMLALDRLPTLAPGDARVGELCDIGMRAADLDIALREHETRRRTRALAGIEAGLGRLRCMSTSAELVDNVCKEIVRSLGFSRAMLSRIEDDKWQPWLTHFSHREVRPSDVEWMAKTKIPLSSMLLERALIEERHAGFVIDASQDARAQAAFVADTGASSYVAAPVIPAGRVVGFLHADYYPLHHTVDRVDADLLWAFAEGFGRIYERTVLLERLNTQRDHVRDTLRSAESIMDTLARGELELARREDERSMATGAATLSLSGGSSAIDELLTPREREVLSLIVVGQSNGAIATRLVISEGTVKSHVKQILRKVGAANRSEAIARYLGMAGPQ